MFLIWFIFEDKTQILDFVIECIKDSKDSDEEITLNLSIHHFLIYFNIKIIFQGLNLS